jgi:hypothetical protein
MVARFFPRLTQQYCRVRPSSGIFPRHVSPIVFLTTTRNELVGTINHERVKWTGAARETAVCMAELEVTLTNEVVALATQGWRTERASD